MSSLPLFLPSFLGTGKWIQGYCTSELHSQSFSYFLDRVLISCQGWPWTSNLAASAFWSLAIQVCTTESSFQYFFRNSNWLIKLYSEKFLIWTRKINFNYIFALRSRTCAQSLSLGRYNLEVWDNGKWGKTRQRVKGSGKERCTGKWSGVGTSGYQGVNSSVNSFVKTKWREKNWSKLLNTAISGF